MDKAQLILKDKKIELPVIIGSENEKGIDIANGEVKVAVDPYYYRPTEVDQLLGDASKAKNELGWQASISFEELVKIMVNAEVNSLSQRKF